MALKHGRGKEAFRRYTKAMHQTSRDIANAIKSGEVYSSSDIARFYETITKEYTDALPYIGVDVELWSNRAIDFQVQEYDKSVEKFNIAEERKIEEVQSQEEIDNSEQERSRQGEDTIAGIPVMNRDNKRLIRSQGKPRKRILISLEELEEYVQDVPYVIAIQTLLNNDGRVSGYRIWVEASKEKKRRKNAS